MNISENGLELIKNFEGCRLTAYKCPAGVWTIGWGHTGNVKEGQKITQAEADSMLKADMAPYESRVDKYSKYNWNQNEYDALVSFAYNVGSIDQLTAGGTRSRSEIAEKMTAYNKAAGKTLAGLTRRREAEKKLFLTPVIPEKGWFTENGKWKYYLGNGKPVTNDWYYDDGKWYWFDGSGAMVTNTWYEYKNKWYYLGPDGAMLTGLQTIDKKWYALDQNGAMVTEEVTLTPDQDGALTWPGLKE